MKRKKEKEEKYVDHQQTPATREARVRVGRTVALVVEKYATFIDSTPDHVVNSALKMLLWKDKHFMNWRKQQQQAGRGMGTRRKTAAK